MLKHPEDPNEETTRSPNVRRGGPIHRFVAVLAVLGVAFAALVAFAAPGYAWEIGTPTAKSECVSGSGIINGTFTNNEAPGNDMNVSMVYGSLSDGPKTVPAGGGPVSFTIDTGQQTLQAGDVTFTMTWANGTPGTDQVTAHFDAVDCTPPPPPATSVTPALTASTPDCVNTDKVVTNNSPAGVIWTPALPYTLHPGESQTFVASPGDTYVFTDGAQTSFPVTNDFDVKSCDLPPTTAGYTHHLSTTCTSGTGYAAADKGNDSPLTLTVKVGKGSGKWNVGHYTVKPGSKGQVRVPGKPGDTILQLVGNKVIDRGQLEKDCGHKPPPPPPVCTHNCHPTPPPPTPECVGYDTNHNGVIDQSECVPTTTAETGLGDIVGASSDSSSRGGWSEGLTAVAGLLLLMLPLSMRQLKQARRR